MVAVNKVGVKVLNFEEEGEKKKTDMSGSAKGWGRLRSPLIGEIRTEGDIYVQPTPKPHLPNVSAILLAELHRG